MVNVGAAPSEYQPTPTRGDRPEEEEDGAVVGELNHQQPTPEAAPSEAALAPQSPQEVVPVPADPAESQENNKSEARNSPSETVATPVEETSSAEKLLDTQFVEQANRKRSANSSIPAEEFEMSLNQVERQNRPRSVQDPNQRKEVRFADTQEGSDPVRRSYSALPRLSNDDESKENRDDNRGSCKDESTNIYTRGRREDDDDDDLAGGDNPGRGTGGGTGSQNAGSAQGSTSPTKQGQSQGENNGNKGNGGKQQALKMANSTLNQGFEDPEAGERKRSPMRRPRSQLGTWEDVLKPDNNPCALSIEGVRQSWSEATFDQYQQSSESNNVRKKYNGEEPVNSATIAYNRKSRPRSAKGPKDYKAEEEEKAARKLRRPQSASSYKIISTDESVMMGLARMNTRDSKPAVKERSYNVSVSEGAATVLKRNQLGSTTEVRRRPASAQVVSAAGIRRRPTSAHGARTTTAKARRPKSAVPSNREARSKSNCTYCGKSATKTINYHHGIFFSVCNTCSQQSQGMQQASDMCNSNETSVEQTAGNNEPELEDEVVMPVEREEEIVGMTHIEGFVDHSRNNRSGEKSADAGSPLNEGQMLTNLDDLDKSLSLVQQEIRNCIQQTSQRIEMEQVPEASGSVHVIPSPDVMAEGNGVRANRESSESECTQAEFSQALTDADVPKSGFAYRMTVFQFSDETSQTTEEKPAEVGDISSYEVTMMNEADGQSVKAEKEAEGMALLNTLCQQLKNSEMMGGGEKSVKAPLDTSPLQVIATSKTMSQPKTSCGAANPIAPVAPLCFRVNARPPRGSLYYFAYGMDMNPHRFSNYIGRSTEERFWGLLYGFRLAFNKKGLDTEAGGFPNILFDQASAVEGCLYLVSPEEINVLDKCMGYPGHFEHVMLPVWLLNCNDPNGLGVAQYCVPALMYIAKDEWIHTGPDALDNSYALDQCLKGANILSDSYKDNMAAMRQFTTRSS